MNLQYLEIRRPVKLIHIDNVLFESVNRKNEYRSVIDFVEHALSVTVFSLKGDLVHIEPMVNALRS